MLHVFIQAWLAVQIIFESLPVSSSGHVTLLQRWFEKLENVPAWLHNQQQVQMFNYVLHGPTIIILFLLLFSAWWQLIVCKPMHMRVFLEKHTQKALLQLMLFGGIADGITCIAWWFDLILPISLTIGFVVTAMLLYTTRYLPERKQQFAMNYGYAFCLGMGQALSLSPGISRFATTFAVGRWYGYSNRISFAISFLIQMPLLCAAFLKGIVTVQKNSILIDLLFSWQSIALILIASVISYYVLRWVYFLTMKNKLWHFSWYMVIPSIISLLV